MIHGTDELLGAMTTSSASLISTALTAGAACALLASAGLIEWSFTATMAAASPIAGVLGLVWSFIHRRPVLGM